MALHVATAIVTRTLSVLRTTWYRLIIGCKKEKTIMSKIGSGAYGDVFLQQDGTVQKQCQLELDDGLTDLYRSMAENEVYAAEICGKAGISPVVTATNFTDTHMFLSMHLCRDTFEHIFKRASAEQQLQLILQACIKIAVCHSLNIRHRDCTMKNFMVNHKAVHYKFLHRRWLFDKEVMLIDFGLSTYPNCGKTYKGTQSLCMNVDFLKDPVKYHLTTTCHSTSSVIKDYAQFFIGIHAVCNQRIRPLVKNLFATLCRACDGVTAVDGTEAVRLASDFDPNFPVMASQNFVRFVSYEISRSKITVYSANCATLCDLDHKYLCHRIT